MITLKLTKKEYEKLFHHCCHGEDAIICRKDRSLKVKLCSDNPIWQSIGDKISAGLEQRAKRGKA